MTPVNRNAVPHRSLCLIYRRTPHLSIDNFFRDHLIRLVMAADRVSADDLRDLLQDVAQLKAGAPCRGERQIK